VNFDLSEDEDMLKAVAERFVLDRYGPDQRRAYLANETGFSTENWQQLAGLGLIAALFPVAQGGLGIGQVGLAALFEALGRGLVVEPLIENVALAGGLLAGIATPELSETWTARLISGDVRVALAHREKSARNNLTWVETRARKEGDSYVLNGAKSLVPAGAGVAAYIVSARISGHAGDSDGVGLFLIDANAPNLAVHPWRTVDGGVAVSLTLDNVIVSAANHLGGGLSGVQTWLDRANLFNCAEMLGIMERLFADTLEYLRTRKQFGTPLGSFQVLQHRMVAQYAALGQARALLNIAMMTDPADTARWRRAILCVRAFLSQASLDFGHEMIQMHGGMGVTDELIIGQGHKRLMMLSRWPEDPVSTLDRYIAA
jgi:alkylation response protein AidB-like acyl-CoA dehydrogenase